MRAMWRAQRERAAVRAGPREGRNPAEGWRPGLWLPSRRSPPSPCSGPPPAVQLPEPCSTLTRSQREEGAGAVAEQALATASVGAVDATEASRLNRPPPCRVRVLSTPRPSRPRRWKSRRMRRWRSGWRRWASSPVRCVASSNRTEPSGDPLKRPSWTTTWKWNYFRTHSPPTSSSITHLPSTFTFPGF
jgi:hypothetical protein